MSIISDYNESKNSLVYTSNEFLNEVSNNSCVEIQLTMIHTLVAKIRYFYDLDILIVGDYERNIFKVDKFSTINTEEQYFQQSTIQDCSVFEYEDVEPFLKHIKRILDEAESPTIS